MTLPRSLLLIISLSKLDPIFEQGRPAPTLVNRVAVAV
jgi:hypothetical protein